ncbi:hypothetical protein ACEPAF_8944 [Sanghuangporus sanghuang]
MILSFAKASFLLALVSRVAALGQDSCVTFAASDSSFPVVDNGRAASVYVSDDDWLGVQRAASDFVADINRVTGVTPELRNVSTSDSSSLSSNTPVIIVGTLGHSSLIDAVLNNTQLNVSAISGQWEAYVSRQVSNPLPGVSSAYVIVGSDKRGTTFALYDHSEQFGVSPWYWWADVPTTKHESIFISSPGCSHGSPTVKYRGIFINDEQPALQNWVMEKFSNGTGSYFMNSPFNSKFYSKLFELILRLKGNYLWPAMWGSAFALDDTLNQYTADMYGVVMGTSHQEPMMRSSPNEWNIFGEGPWNYSSNSENIYKYFVEGAERARPYESLFTLGMRGEGDLPLEESTNIALLETIVADQRQILADVFNTSDVTTIPQLWTLYKEVQGYYEDGMRVPDDVILLWADDNWGNIRRYPIESERNRTGGAGVYYHFDFVGDPRNYKWITSTQISKTYEQMSIAAEREATAVWIVNVGDLKPYELNTEFFLTYGWDTSRWNHANLDTFVHKWAERDFKLDENDASLVTEIIGNLTRWNARRKPELLNGTTYSLIDYREADTVLADWEALVKTSTSIYDKLPESTKPTFFQTVHHPVLASYVLSAMWIYQGMNTLRASQARLSTNDLAGQVEELFAQDYELEDWYHSILDGALVSLLTKTRKGLDIPQANGITRDATSIMDQTHVMYYYWQQPMANTMPPVSKIQAKKEALAGPMRIAPEGTRGAWPGDNVNQCAEGYNCPLYSLNLDRYAPIQEKYVDVGAGGPNAFTFTATTNVSWLTLMPTEGSISPSNPEIRVEGTVDWSQVPASNGSQAAAIYFNATLEGQDEVKQSTTVYFVATNYNVSEGFSGFVEGDGGISIEAAHASRNTSVSGVTWTELPGYGRTVSGVTPLPHLANNGANFSVGEGPSLEYDFFIFNIPTTGLLNVTTLVSPSLNANGDDRQLGFAVQLDALPAQSEYFIPLAEPGELPDGWGGLDGFVANSIVSVQTNFNASEGEVAPGAHTLKIWMIEPAVVIQKIVIDTGDVRTSYLGPPESVRL